MRWRHGLPARRWTSQRRRERRTIGAVKVHRAIAEGERTSWRLTFTSPIFVAAIRNGLMRNMPPDEWADWHENMRTHKAA